MKKNFEELEKRWSGCKKSLQEGLDCLRRQRMEKLELDDNYFRFTITLNGITVSWNVDVEEYRKSRTGLEIMDKVLVFLKILDGEEEKKKETDCLKCLRCGKIISSPVPKDTVVRAFLECPECVEKLDECREVDDRGSLITLNEQEGEEI